MTDIEWLDAGIRGRGLNGLASSDLRECRAGLVADREADEFVAWELATRTDWTQPEP